MATERVHQQESLEYGITSLLERLEEMRREAVPRLLPPKAETRSLQFWRSIISECLASFFYVFIVCGAAAGVASGGSTAQTILAASFASGFSIAALTQSFAHISGAHVNPAVSVAMVITRNISLLRGIMFVTAQCGGGIAGAALLYGVTLPGKQSTLSATVAQLPAHLSPWERFGLELILSFMVVFTYFVASDRKHLGGSALTVGSAYLAATIVSMPSLNPARALGPAFVMNKWENHWVYWFGPILGGVIAGLIFEFIFNPRRHFRRSKDSIDGDSSSIHSDEDTYDELDKPRSTYNTMRPVQPGADIYRPVGAMNTSSPTGGNAYCGGMATTGLYSAPPCKLDRVESLYGGTKSLYCKSPPLTRANLNRSQSVYTKTPGGGPPMLHRPEPGMPRPGPLVPAQSLYPMRLNSVSSSSSAATAAANQNQQNQQRLGGGGEGLYGPRPTNPPADRIYRKLPGRPESVYNQRQEAAESAYCAYQSAAASGQQQQQQQQPQQRSNYAPVPKPQPTPGYHLQQQQHQQQQHQQQQHQQQQQQQQPPQQQQQQQQSRQDQQELGIPTAGPPPPYMHQQRESPSQPY